jgi:hypothetical protein
MTDPHHPDWLIIPVHKWLWPRSRWVLSPDGTPPTADTVMSLEGLWPTEGLGETEPYPLNSWTSPDWNTNVRDGVPIDVGAIPYEKPPDTWRLHPALHGINSLPYPETEGVLQLGWDYLPDYTPISKYTIPYLGWDYDTGKPIYGLPVDEPGINRAINYGNPAGWYIWDDPHGIRPSEFRRQWEEGPPFGYRVIFCKPFYNVVVYIHLRGKSALGITNIIALLLLGALTLTGASPVRSRRKRGLSGSK